MFGGIRSAFILLLTLHWGVSSAPWCHTSERTCDFVCDCDDCSDELHCGFDGEGFTCDFESGWCGWTDPSSTGPYRWERLQGEGLMEGGPSSDYTSGTGTGWFLGVSAVGEESPHTAVLISPEMKEASPTCRIHLRYFLWDSGVSGLGSAPLWASIRHQDGGQAVIWRPEASSVHGWREASIFVGGVFSPFRIRFHSQRSEGGRGDVALDQMEFLDCSLPLPLPGDQCPVGMRPCSGGGCVDLTQVCDGTNDCGDGSDEETCDYQLCDFEEDECNWDLRSISNLKWIRTNQRNISTTDPMMGPGRDHSTNTRTGHFLYVTVPDSGLKEDWASFQSPSLEPTNSSHPCKMVMYTHQFGPRSGGLTVLVADRAIYPVWERGGALGDLWVKAEVDIITNTSFQIVIMAAVRNFSYGGVAIDSILLSPECRLSSVNTSLEVFPKVPKDPCAEPELMCDFHSDCEEEEDEDECGDFSYSEGSSGWTDSSVGPKRWTLFKNHTDRAQDYLCVTAAPGQQLTEAQTRTPPLGPSGPACTLTFDYSLTGGSEHIGELSVRVIDSMLGAGPKLWEFGGRTGPGKDEWKHNSITVGVRQQRFQLVFEAQELTSGSEIKVRNVTFLSCHAGYFPSSLTGLSCNFDDDLCGWYQDNSDSFDWTVLSGMDHTIGAGRSLVVNMWNPSLRGSYGRLLSFPQAPGSSDRCLSFFYKLYGSNPGSLNVKLLYDDGHEAMICTRTGSHGNQWHEAHCFIPHQIETYQLVFEAVRSGFDGLVSIDDVSLVERRCRMTRSCSFEGEVCGYKSSGSMKWLHLRGQDATKHRPERDHTLETTHGSYMLLDTSESLLPSGGSALITSPSHKGTAHTDCLSFWFHMGGAKPGFLSVYLRPTGGERVKLFSSSGSGETWRHGNSNISAGIVDWQLEFEVIGGGGSDTHVAIDDITVSPHQCEDPGSRCSLEEGVCSWSNTQNTELDELDWVMTSPHMENHYPSPDVDHTLGSERGHFLLLTSSERTGASQRADLLSHPLPPTKGTCLTFYVYSTSSGQRQLSVWRRSGGRVHQLMELQNLQERWTRFDINVVSTEQYQMVFEGIKGSSGFLALDDIEFTPGRNCENLLTDSHRAPSDNRGGVAASVVVVLLLICTLVGLLVYYLQNKRPSSSSSSSSSSRGGFTNDVYECETTDRVRVPPPSHHRPMEAGFTDVTISDDVAV
ncbi:apical endosomal glycoprotein [Gouania willdenowi]|uniref:Apical endosomal glycoprotein-like n=1 Tax=Gouania willdenowi TaxID=441366 RepID=A0A8C5DPI3_GOUWI|nr:apical endosomal glycoprotein-like [Gouania willdenowi]